MPQPGAQRDGELVTKASPFGVAETVDRLVELVTARGMTVFATLDQSAEARRVGLDLRDTRVVLFGNPVAGTPVMVASPLAALDLPLKVVVWADRDGTSISYLAPDALGARHHLAPELWGPLAGIDALTDALIAPCSQ